jgi:AcrR family transcriptional regulator
MTPRPYEPQERQRGVDAGRERILAAARDLLQLDNLSVFSLDAVARGAGVTRMTVYNQFGSRAGLLAELFDLLIERGAFRDIPAAFTEKDVGVAFDVFVGILGRFYTENRPVMTRLAAAAGQDPDLDLAMRSRNERRKRAIETLVQRLRTTKGLAVAPGELVQTLDVLLNFATFSGIAGPDRTPSDVVPHMRRLVRALLGLKTRARPTRSGPTKKRGRSP